MSVSAIVKMTSEIKQLGLDQIDYNVNLVLSHGMIGLIKQISIEACILLKKSQR
jgi:hypothetical protein